MVVKSENGEGNDRFDLLNVMLSTDNRRRRR